jgi:hypothetical protein
MNDQPEMAAQGPTPEGLLDVIVVGGGLPGMPFPAPTDAYLADRIAADQQAVTAAKVTTGPSTSP